MDEVPILSIIIVTWNCRDLILRCLATLASAELFARCEVIVVDNNSTDGTQDLVAATYPHVILHRNVRNAGFAGGTNIGIRLARAPNLLLLNPDAFPSTPQTLARMIDALQRHPEYAAIGCRLVFPDGRHQVGDAGFRPTLPHVLIWALGLHSIPPLRGLFLARPERVQRPVSDVDWLCAACMMVRACMVRAIGMLDERYFMYAEDVEWCCRMRDRGWRVGYLADESVVHLQGGTQKVEPAEVRCGWIDSLGKLFLSRNKRSKWSIFCLLLSLGFGLRALAYGIKRPDPGKARTMLAYARHALRMQRVAPSAAAQVG